MNDPTHYPLSQTLKGIRLRAGYSLVTLAQKLEVPEQQVKDFEEHAWRDDWLMYFYGQMARRTERVKVSEIAAFNNQLGC